MTTRHMIFILDGGPTAKTCSLENCTGDSVGTFEVVDDDTNGLLATVNLCHDHAKKLSTGYFGEPA